jgi:hypothetical protein
MSTYRSLHRRARWRTLGRRSTWCLSLLLAAGLSACGSAGTAQTVTEVQAGPKSAAGSSVQPSHAQVIAAGDAICTKYNAKLKTLALRLHAVVKRQGLSEPEVGRLAAPIIEEAAALVRSGSASITHAPAPVADVPVLTKIEVAFSEEATVLSEFAHAEREDEVSSIKTIKREESVAKARVKALEQGYGFTVCGVGGVE